MSEFLPIHLRLPNDDLAFIEPLVNGLQLVLIKFLNVLKGIIQVFKVNVWKSYDENPNTRIGNQVSHVLKYNRHAFVSKSWNYRNVNKLCSVKYKHMVFSAFVAKFIS